MADRNIQAGVQPAPAPAKPKPSLMDILAKLADDKKTYYGYPIGVLHDNYRVLPSYSNDYIRSLHPDYPQNTMPVSSFSTPIMGYRYRDPALNGVLPNGQPDPRRQSTLPGLPLENKATPYDSRRLYGAARAVAQARNLGVPQISAEGLAAIALKEGNHAGVGPFGLDSSAPYADFTDPRTGEHQRVHDYGKVFVDENNRRIRGYDPTQAWQRDYYYYMTSHGMSEEGALMALKLMDKQGRAKNHGSNDPFSQWLGTGVSRYDETAKDYTRQLDKFRHAATLPQNKKLVEYIRQALEDGAQYELPAYPNNTGRAR